MGTFQQVEDSGPCWTKCWSKPLVDFNLTWSLQTASRSSGPFPSFETFFWLFLETQEHGPLKNFLSILMPWGSHSDLCWDHQTSFNIWSLNSLHCQHVWVWIQNLESYSTCCCIMLVFDCNSWPAVQVQLWHQQGHHPQSVAEGQMLKCCHHATRRNCKAQHLAVLLAFSQHMRHSECKKAWSTGSRIGSACDCLEQQQDCLKQDKTISRLSWETLSWDSL